MRDFSGNWFGTGTISGTGDAEKITLEEGEYMVSEIIETGDQYVELDQNVYAAGDDVVMKYRTGATPAACFGAAWEVYYSPFQSSGYVQVRLEPTLTLELSISQDGRYLTSGGTPFLLVGDSPQGLMAACTPAQMATYMANRQGYGVNCIQVHLLAGTTFGGANNTTFPAQDGTTPFTTTGDISTPREAYFAQVDDMLALAESYGMVVVLTVNEHIDGITLFSNNVANAADFGTYLGNRYKDVPNLIWNYGNDYTYTQTPNYDTALTDIHDAIAAVDTVHLHTLWRNQVSSRIDDDLDYIADLDFGYTYNVTWGQAQLEYARTPVKPYHLGEAGYEGESPGYEITPNHIRRQAWWTMLWGGCGYVYCNEDIYHFSSGWGDRLDSFPGLAHVEHMKSLLSTRSWYALIPDSDHTILTAGMGTHSDTGAALNTNDFATCGYLTDGSLALIYMPTNRTMTVDMSQFSGTVTCRWFDPTDGSYTADAASPHANSGTHDFSHAGTNAAGDADWVLVLEVA